MLFEISTSPTKIKINNYISVNEEVLELKDPSFIGPLFWCFVSLPFLFYFLWQVLYNNQFSFFYKIPLILCLFVFISCGLTVIFMPKKKLTFFRTKGVVFFRDSKRRKEASVDFNTLKFSIKDNTLKVINPKNISSSHKIFLGINAVEDLSLLIWYMDKNRPLPPHKVFDEYRNLDFERRKAEGFPPPLYKSKIITPEATPEQQAEREKYWKDKKYMVS